jgi:hypothetical protein
MDLIFTNSVVKPPVKRMGTDVKKNDNKVLTRVDSNFHVHYNNHR